jgi:Putative addiction module component
MTTCTSARSKRSCWAPRVTPVPGWPNCSSPAIGDGGHPQPFPMDQALADLRRITDTAPEGSDGIGYGPEAGNEAALQRLEADLLGRPATVREFVANLLFPSLKTREEIEAAWAKENERRYQAYLSGEVAGISAEEFIAKARARLKR